jgi:hypothetical protein
MLGLVIGIVQLWQTQTAAQTSSPLTVQPSTARVGVGTPNPSQELTVMSSTGGDGLLIQNSAPGSRANLDLQSTDVNGVTWRLTSAGNASGRAGNLEVNQESTPFVTIQKDTGNVGIGTANPARRLDVTGGDIEGNRYLRLRAWADNAPLRHRQYRRE